jgi:aspartokinase
MISIPEIVRQIVKKSPFLEEGLSLGIINNSALARIIKPEVEIKLYKKVQTGAIIMALKRMSANMVSNPKQQKLRDLLRRINDITVRSNIIELTYVNTPSLIRKQVTLTVTIKKDTSSFLTISEGVFETSFFASDNFENQIEKIFEGETLKSKIKGLSSITIILPQEATQTSGVYYAILKKLAWEGINFVEVVSSFTELTLFVEDLDIDSAFSALKKM